MKLKEWVNKLSLYFTYVERIVKFIYLYLLYLFAYISDLNEVENAFSKTGALTIKSSSSSSGGLAGALGQ